MCQQGIKLLGKRHAETLLPLVEVPAAQPRSEMQDAAGHVNFRNPQSRKIFRPQREHHGQRQMTQLPGIHLAHDLNAEVQRKYDFPQRILLGR